jgi:hypothetical protein
MTPGVELNASTRGGAEASLRPTSAASLSLKDYRTSLKALSASAGFALVQQFVA